MRFRIKKWQKYHWHKWFAWRPIIVDFGINSKMRVWMEYVWRKGENHPCGDNCIYIYWYYKFLEDEPKKHA